MGSRILIVDDDCDVLTILGIRLTRVGFEVTTVSDGIAGLAALRETSPCGVVLDLFMPNMNGFEFLSALRRHVPAPPPPVFVVTQADDVSIRERVCRLGAERLISKGDALGREFALALAQRLGLEGDPARFFECDRWPRHPFALSPVAPAVVSSTPAG